MSKKATEFQKKEMSKMYRGTEIFKPLNTGWTDENVACVREWVANIFFYRRGGTTIMIDAGYNYERLEAKMGWLGIDPKSIKHILITHQDTDHIGGARPYVTMRSCKNQFYYDLITPLPDKLDVPGTQIHIFYALKMGEKYRERYERHFAQPVIHEQDMQHEELLACHPEEWAQLVKSIIS